tara:strand:+ start:116 stop:364 length:249 start_codon:yes stop_codon:yes gene_type:complete
MSAISDKLKKIGKKDMNSKKSKLLRKLLKEQGIDPQHTLYIRQDLKVRDRAGNVRAHGNPPIKLDPNCGRAKYRRAKAIYNK